MAARLTAARRARGLTRASLLARSAVLVLAASATLVACTSVDRPTVQSDEVALPTPMRSFDASVASTLDELAAAVGALGERLEDPAAAFRPSEPPSLLQLPRVIRRAALADPDDAFVVVYQAEDTGAAIDRGQDLADYLSSGFGQTNYVADTQFSVSVLGDTVIFTNWSSRRSDDPARAEAVFDAMAAVGTPVEVQK